MRWGRKWRSNKRAEPCLPELGVDQLADRQGGGRETEGEKVVDRGAGGVRRKKVKGRFEMVGQTLCEPD